MNDARPIRDLLQLPPAAPGTARLTVVAACFRIAGILGVLATAALLGPVVAQAWTFRSIPPQEMLELLSVSLVTVACLRTARLLRHRQLEGVVMAIACLAGSITTNMTAGFHWWGAYVVPITGLVLLASVWHHLD